MTITTSMQEIDELLGQNLTQDDEDAIAAELESILVVRCTRYCSVTPRGWGVWDGRSWRAY